MATIIENGLAATTSGADSFITSDLIITGAVHWVDSVNGNDSYAGTEGRPLASLTQAITNATASNGDVIVIKSGSTFTLTSAITINKAGLKIFGIGEGSSAPQFTVNASSIVGIDITAAAVEINNLYFPVGTTAANTARVQIGAAGVKVKGCTFMCGAYDSESVLLTASATYATIESCSFTVSASGPTIGIKVNSASATGLRIEDCAFDGGTYNWTTAAISSGYAHTNFVYDTCTFTNDASIAHTANAKGFLTNMINGDGSAVQV